MNSNECMVLIIKTTPRCLKMVTHKDDHPKWGECTPPLKKTVNGEIVLY